MPVIRIYGCTKRGQTVCGNIHNYLPYLFIEFPYELFKRSPNQNQSEFVFELAKEMEEQFNICEKKKNEGKRFNYVYKQLIHEIKILKGFNSFYGFHNEKEQLFLKIEIYNPIYMRDFREVLFSGLIQGY